MSIKKTYPKSRDVCRVTFSHPASAAGQVFLVGDFNDWEPTATPMKKNKKNGYSITLELPPGREYEFRYFIDGQGWANDDKADQYRDTSFHDAKNCVVVT